MKIAVSDAVHIDGSDESEQEASDEENESQVYNEFTQEWEEYTGTVFLLTHAITLMVWIDQPSAWSQPKQISIDASNGRWSTCDLEMRCWSLC